ncbi:MAG: glycosyltransferase family A protein [Nitrospiraceae bacterium]|nr:glycosyltransferase family A protein [Nitrospiraceae bacterium]
MATSPPLINVIMPLYNKRPYVRRAIDSIMGQTYTNWELIIVDDGSTDASADMVPRGNPRLKLLRQANRGPSAARNAAVRSASGEYLAFIDADDCYYPFKLEKGIDLLWRDQKAEWMMSAYDYQLNGVTTRRYIKDVNDAEIKEDSAVFDDALSQLTVVGWPSDGLFMKKSLFERLGGFNEEIRYGEISEFILRCALEEPKVAICHVPLFLHIDVPGSTAKNPAFKTRCTGLRGRIMYGLAKNYPHYSNYLLHAARDYMTSYASTLILEGEGRKARRFLMEEYPFARDRKWFKLWAAGWLPQWFLGRMSPQRKRC